MSGIGSWLGATTIGEWAAKFASSFFDFIIDTIIRIVSVILTPIDSFISSIFPDLTKAVESITNFFQLIITGPVAFFLSILNNFPIFKNLIFLSLSFDLVLVSAFGIYMLIQGTIVVITKIRGVFH